MRIKWEEGFCNLLRAGGPSKPHDGEDGDIGGDEKKDLGPG